MAGIQHPEAESYRQSGWGNEIVNFSQEANIGLSLIKSFEQGFGKKPALLIIDVCKAYWSSGSPLDLSKNAAALEAPNVMRRLLKAAREGQCPVVHTTIDYTDMSQAGLFWTKSKAIDVWLRSDNRGLNAFLEGLEPQDGDTVIAKLYPSSFFGTSLASALTVMQVDTLVICGGAPLFIIPLILASPLNVLFSMGAQYLLPAV
ncbi:MAG: hypothetical protein CYPHOPRED_004335, partial [Cyphobasidiales sp. Tagirdzhanova-0007]